MSGSSCPGAYADRLPQLRTPDASSTVDPASHDDHLGLKLRRPGPPQCARADQRDADDEGGQARPHSQRGGDQHREDAGEHRRGPAAHREPHHDRTHDTRSGVARPGREHPPETARRAHRDGVPGHVTAQDEAGEPAAAQHPDAGVPELVDEGDAEAQYAPQRVDRHRHEGREEHHDHWDTRQGDALIGHHSGPHLLEPVHDGVTVARERGARGRGSA